MKFNVNQAKDSSSGNGGASKIKSGSCGSSSSSTPDAKPASKSTAKSDTTPIKYAFGAPTPKRKQEMESAQARWVVHSSQVVSFKTLNSEYLKLAQQAANSYVSILAVEMLGSAFVILTNTAALCALCAVPWQLNAAISNRQVAHGTHNPIDLHEL